MEVGEHVKRLQDRGYKVTRVIELNELWQNNHTKEVCRVIGSYSLADRAKDYGTMYLFEDGDGWRKYDLRQYWTRHDSK
jgi:hypothetical protein